MKKSIFIALSFLLIPLVSCGQEKKDNEIQILSFNDFHGAVRQKDEQMGLLNFATTIKNKQSENKDGTILLSAGDMYQGSAESNIGKGKVVIDVMNELGLEAMTIGNHEFDWGISELEKHHDGIKENNEANYDYLGCNIYEVAKSSDESDTRVDWAKDYKIIERKDVKVGVIGWIGTICMDAIANSIVEPYVFTNPVDRIIELAKDLRQNQGCNIIVAMGHDSNNLQASELGTNKEAKIDLIIEGHTHNVYLYENGTYNVIQSECNGAYLGVTNIKIDATTKEVISVKSKNETIVNVEKKDTTISKIITDDLKEVEQVTNEVIGVAGELIDRPSGAKWAANVLRSITGSDIGIINWGGIRSAAFPIRMNDNIKVANMWELMPFDNAIKITTLSGSQVKELVYNDDSFVFSDGFKENEIVETEKYVVSACDYIFDKPKYCFKDGENIIATPILVRDALIEDIKAWTAQDLKFMPSQGTKVNVQI